MPGRTFPEKAYCDDDWRVCEGVEDLGFAFSNNRRFPGSSPTAKVSGIKGRRGNPTIQQMAYSGGAGIDTSPTDQVWTIWASTFRETGEAVLVMPKRGDIILVNQQDSCGALAAPLTVVERWIVQWSKWTLYGAQFLCYCIESPLNEDAIY